MGADVPLLNDYKREFFWKRFPQTLLGGPKLRLGFRAPAYVYACQVLLFLLPWFLGGLFTSLVQYDLLQYDVAAYGSGTLMVICVLVLQILSAVKKRKCASVSPATKTKNILSEEDIVDFDSCCGAETVNYVIPPKKYIANIVIHSLLSGPVVGLATWYLLPSTLNGLYGDNTAVTAVLFILGWFSVCIGQYSLSAGVPPETAVYRTTDSYETLAFSRPIYLLLCFSFHVVAQYRPSFTQTNEVLHVVLVLLPVLWTLGVLPPIDALVLWLLEQGLFILFGGSPLASDLRLIIISVMSVACFLLAYFIPYGCQTVIIMAACGYLLSIDLGGLGTKILNRCRHRTPDTAKPGKAGFLWDWTVKEFVFHLCMILLVGGLAAITCIFVKDNQAVDSANIASYMGYAVIGVLVLGVVFSDIQSVYICIGLVGNALFPASVDRNENFKLRKRKLIYIGHIRRVLVDFIGPFAMLIYLTLTFNFSNDISQSSLNSTVPLLNILGANRAFRWVWQSSQNSMLEIAVVQILQLALPADSTSWRALGVGAQLIIISVSRDRLARILDKLFFWLMLTIKSWTDKKQRRKSSATLVALNFLLFPLVLVAMVISAALAAPLLPLFTLPLFFIGFPRPTRFWPGSVGASQNTCPDTIYYQQAAPQVARAFRTGFFSGSIGWPAPGKHYIVRFQDRLIWVQILERGYCYCTVSIKGMELQETSCHAVEATRVDDIMESAFERTRKCGCMGYPLHTVRPYDAMNIKTYSDAKNQLTGVIDSPDTLKLIKSSFVQTMVWVLFNHIKDNRENDSFTPAKASDVSNQPASPAKQQNGKVHGGSPVEDECDFSLRKHPKGSSGTAERPHSRGGVSVNSFANSVWSDDNDSLLDHVDGPSNGKPGNKIKLVQGSDFKNDASILDLPPVDVKPQSNAFGNQGKKDDIDDLFDQLDFGLPATDVNDKTKQFNPHPALGSSTTKQTARPQFSTRKGDFKLESKYSLSISLPEKWIVSPVDQGKLQKHTEQFSSEWFKYVILQLKMPSMDEKKALEISVDPGLQEMYRSLVLTCYAIIYDLGLAGSDVVSAGPGYVHKMYKGEVPWSVASDWLTDDKTLLAVVLKAYRYAVKLAIDQTLLGDASSHEELREYLAEYDTDWFIGSEKDPEWNAAITEAKPQLFSLSHDTSQNTHNSRVLSCQETPIYIGTLNPEGVHAQWANLSMELLYMTNDDEERYSIQAQSALLRNLNVQVADPPLGYPIYASEPISIPTL